MSPVGRGTDLVRELILLEPGGERSDLPLGLVVKVLADKHVALVVVGRPELAVVAKILKYQIETLVYSSVH